MFPFLVPRSAAFGAVFAAAFLLVRACDAEDTRQQPATSRQVTDAAIAELQAEANQKVSAAMLKWERSEKADFDTIKNRTRSSILSQPSEPQSSPQQDRFLSIIFGDWRLEFAGSLVSLLCCAVVARYYHIVQTFLSSRPYQSVIAPAVLVAPQIFAALFVVCTARHIFMPAAAMAFRPERVEAVAGDFSLREPLPLDETLRAERQLLDDISLRYESSLDGVSQSIRTAQTQRKSAYLIGAASVFMLLLASLSVRSPRRCPSCNAVLAKKIQPE